MSRVSTYKPIYFLTQYSGTFNVRVLQRQRILASPAACGCSPPASTAGFSRAPNLSSLQLRCLPFPSNPSATSLIVAMDTWAPVASNFQFSVFSPLYSEKERYGRAIVLCQPGGALTATDQPGALERLDSTPSASSIPWSHTHVLYYGTCVWVFRLLLQYGRRPVSGSSAHCLPLPPLPLPLPLPLPPSASASSFDAPSTRPHPVLACFDPSQLRIGQPFSRAPVP